MINDQLSNKNDGSILICLPYLNDAINLLQGALSKEVSFVEANDLDMSSKFAGSLVADVLLFPFETVLHRYIQFSVLMYLTLDPLFSWWNRLHIQGTRTIIDNLDTGASVIPILTRYDGFFDCWNTITREEGRWGLYKGFGALVLQYALQLSIIKGSLFTFYHMGDLFKSTSVQPTSPRNQASSVDRRESPKSSPVSLGRSHLQQQFN